MFIVLLRFSTNREHAGEFMEGHNAWLRDGFDEGAFLLAGSLQPGLGGAVVAQAPSLEELERRVADDPFVEQNVVHAEILEISPGMAEERLQFLLN